ncbi:MAG: uridine kinase [Clostridiales bacterium]|nr:uridine kinase [Clostridiales bacterium]
MTTIRYTDFSSLAPLTSLCTAATAEHPLVIALDGFCASGKTTLAEELHTRFGARVIHTDDFYLPAQMRTDERYAEPGGTIHYERLRAEVIDCLGEPVLTYGVFSHAVMDIVGHITLPFAPVTVIEGAYASHPALGDYMNVRCFMETAPDEQRRRILARNGPERLWLFEERWIPYEIRYEAAFGIRARTDFHILT